MSLSTFHPWSRLPLEIKVKILSHLFPALMIPESETHDTITSIAEQMIVGNLADTSEDIRQALEILLANEPMLQPLNSAAQWIKVPFSTTLPMLNRFPFLEEAVVVVDHLDSLWNIQGFQEEGPDIVAPRNPAQGWGLQRVGPHLQEAADYFESRGIIADTGITWELPKLWTNEYLDLMSADVDLPARVDPSTRLGSYNDRPRIGLRGYSRGTMSIGGKWAGFRYHTDTHKVEFSPLAWHEVQPYIDRLCVKFPDMTQPLPRRTDPMFVSRVWIIREGQVVKDEPHHCWIPVKQYDEDEDEDWVQQVETTWKMVQGTLLRRGIEIRYKFQMH
ncbi:hypothetical protein F53441_4836 [Fusarium austroafricanum]|uniref:Uncharacterized protein n=1 Tax=Fusarium austroafricanum TaxID=2364996 RepID=A0A8H4KMC3_9HYPO|nr:hypothetical protein F53441_4836 [Fusarium austroafricanum]